MGELKKFFFPENKEEKMTMGIILIVVIGFCVVEGFMFMEILNNPYELDEWRECSVTLGRNYLILDHSELFNLPIDMEDHKIFEIPILIYNETLHIELNPINCIMERIVLMEGYYVDTSYSHGAVFFYKYQTRYNVSSYVDIFIETPREEAQFLFIKVKEMASTDVRLLYRMNILE